MQGRDQLSSHMIAWPHLISIIDIDKNIVWYINFEFNRIVQPLLSQRERFWISENFQSTWLQILNKCRFSFDTILTTTLRMFFNANASASLSVSLKNFWYKSQDLVYFIYFFVTSWIEFSKKKKKIILLFHMDFSFQWGHLNFSHDFL